LERNGDYLEIGLGMHAKAMNSCDKSLHNPALRADFILKYQYVVSAMGPGMSSMVVAVRSGSEI
jgi:hypothetical protein